jgi:UDP-glucose 4-epimerase
MQILVTGGTGFIGSHTVVELLQEGYDVVIVDNLYNSKEMVVDRIETITGKRPKFYPIDVLDREALEKVFEQEQIDAVIHFAGYKAVGESTRKPIEYYYNNIGSTLVLCDVMRKHNCRKIVFSSSATVYGDPAFVPITEDCPKGDTTNPYGTTKAMQERILTDIWKSDENWQVMLLRYFNPIGAHESGLIGEKPNGIPNNLMPYITQVAQGIRPKLNVFGNDYNTPDGTCIRDYVNVEDLAEAHRLALEYLEKNNKSDVFNLGTENGNSVKDIFNACEKVLNRNIDYEIVARRDGDAEALYANANKVKLILGWTPKRTIEDSIKTAYNWEKQLNQ